MKLLLLLLFVPLSITCQETFDTKDKKSFEKSKAKIEEKLTNEEKTKLEIALKLIAVSAIYQKNNDNDFNNKSLDEISLQNIDGKTYQGAIELAEKFLEADKMRKIGSLSQTIAEQETMKKEYLDLKSKLDILEAKPVRIDLRDGNLVVSCSVTNRSKQFIDTYSTTISYSSTQDAQDGWSCSKAFGGIEIAPNKTIILTCDYNYERAKEKSQSIAWDKIKFPISNFAQYNIVVRCGTDRLVLNDTVYELPSPIFDEQAEAMLQANKVELKQLEQLKTTLDELELTDE